MLNKLHVSLDLTETEPEAPTATHTPNGQTPNMAGHGCTHRHREGRHAACDGLQRGTTAATLRRAQAGEGVGAARGAGRLGLARRAEYVEC